MGTRIKTETRFEPFLEELTLFNEKDKCLALLTSLKNSQKTFAWKTLISMAEFVLGINYRNKYLIVENTLNEALSFGPKAILTRRTRNAQRFHNLYKRQKFLSMS